MAEKIGENTFTTVMRGYNKIEVDEYINKLKHELEEGDSKYNLLKERLDESIISVKKAREGARVEQKELDDLQEENRRLKKDSDDFAKKQRYYEKVIADKDKEISTLKESANKTKADTDIIKETLISAQRMSDIIKKEAEAKAREIVEQADKDKQKKQDEANEYYNRVKGESDAIAMNITSRKEALLDDYNNALEEVSNFKKDILAIFRRQLMRLERLPDYTDDSDSEECPGVVEAMVNNEMPVID